MTPDTCKLGSLRGFVVETFGPALRDTCDAPCIQNRGGAHVSIAAKGILRCTYREGSLHVSHVSGGAERRGGSMARARSLQSQARKRLPEPLPYRSTNDLPPVVALLGALRSES